VILDKVYFNGTFKTTTVDQRAKQAEQIETYSNAKIYPSIRSKNKWEETDFKQSFKMIEGLMSCFKD